MKKRIIGCCNPKCTFKEKDDKGRPDAFTCPLCGANAGFLGWDEDPPKGGK